MALDSEELLQLRTELAWIRERCPAGIQASLDLYRREGSHVLGGFLQAVVAGNLRKAVSRADLANRCRLVDIVTYCEHFLLPGTWGSAEAVARHDASLHQMPQAA
jgi:hypothetical protein